MSSLEDLLLSYNNGAVDMQCALLTRIQFKESDTQVTVKACGPLVCSPVVCPSVHL